MTRKVVQAVALMLIVLMVAPAAAARPAELDRNEAIRLAQKEAARPTQAVATSHVVGSGEWTVVLKQDGAAANDRIYVMLSPRGEIVEEGWMKNGSLKEAEITRERAVLIAERSVGSFAQSKKAGLVLTPNSLQWEVIGTGRDGRAWTVMIDAFSGKVISTQGNAKAPKLITKERAIAIARGEVNYRPAATSAELTQYRGTAAWKVELTRSNGKHHSEKEIFYIDAVDGKVLSQKKDDQKPAKNISKDQAVAAAKKRVNVATKVIEAKLDNWQGQEVWIVTLVEERNDWAWHIIVLQADGSFRQQIRI